MNTILKIYRTDLKNIVSNWVAFVVILGLMILPALYAWFNIKSAWDPYGNTRGILVAVVNKDKGAEFRGNKVKIGEELVVSLTKNSNMGWQFVNEQEAEHGVKYGKYYASITVPEDFSYKLLSIVRAEPEKAEIIYSVNEKINAIAPKITQKGVSAIKQQIDENFVETVNNILFGVFNKLGIELEKEKPQLRKLVDMVFEADNKIPELNNILEKAYTGAITLQNATERIQSDMPQIEELVKKSSQVATDSKDFLIKFQDRLQKVAPFIKQDLLLTKNILDSSTDFMNTGLNLINDNPIKAKEFITKSRDFQINVIHRLDSINNLINSIHSTSENKVLSKFQDNILDLKSRINNQVTLMNSVLDILNKGQTLSTDALTALISKSKESTEILDTLLNNFDDTIVPAINTTINNLSSIADTALKLLQDTEKQLPSVNEILEKAHSASLKGIEDLKILKDRLPAVERDLNALSQRLKTLDNDEQMNEIISLLKNDAKKESKFLADPVSIKENKLFPIPNYGSGMAPFFSTLSLWVGALILVSLLSVHVSKPSGAKDYEIYFGRYLTFVTIGILQAVTVTLGDIFLLKVYVARPVLFVTYAMVISIVFTMVVYTLVSVLGNIGKALSMILLVLQISASGGTFPIEVTPPFFQKLNPLLPFTYAIGGMREALGGVVWDIFINYASTLLIYFFIAIFFGLSLKTRFNKINKKFVEKFKESDLVEE